LSSVIFQLATSISNSGKFGLSWYLAKNIVQLGNLINTMLNQTKTIKVSEGTIRHEAITSWGIKPEKLC
jgi:hypothetical protein